MVGYIKNEIYAGEKNVVYIGYSQGSTQMYAALGDPHSSTKLQADLEKIITLAPVVSLRDHVTYPLYFLWRAPYLAKDYQKNGGFPFGVPQYQRSGDLPTIYKWMGDIIGYALFYPIYMTERRPEVNNLEMVKKHSQYFPSGSSTKAWVHWKQMALQGKPFRMFDEGSAEKN